MPRRSVLIAALAPAALPFPRPRAVSPAPPAGSLADLRPLASPAPSGSMAPQLTAGPDGRVWMSWLETRPQGGHALRAARLDGARWSSPFTIAAGDSFFANWADFPTLVVRGPDDLVASYLWRVAGGTYAYQVRLVRSRDGGKRWSLPVVPHRDGTPTEHGFVSLLPAPEGTRAVWLDGRKSVRDSAGHLIPLEEGMADMTLRGAVLGEDGSFGGEAELDPRTCDCCQTAAVATARGVLIAYRDRDPGEIRDISLVRFEDGR